MASNSAMDHLTSEIGKETELSKRRQKEREREQEIAEVRMKSKEKDNQKEQEMTEIRTKSREKEEEMAASRLNVIKISMVSHK